MERVYAFIDGFNLYHAIDELNCPHLKWLDLWALAERFVSKRTQRLERVFLFSSHTTWKPGSYRRQRIFFKAVAAKGVEIQLGRFQKGTSECRACGRKWETHEEKQTDVNLASFLIAYAGAKGYDRAILISQDSDFSLPVELVEKLGKPVRVVLPPNRRYGGRLTQLASEKSRITLQQLIDCQLEYRVRDRSGRVVARRPQEYMEK